MKHVTDEMMQRMKRLSPEDVRHSTIEAVSPGTLEAARAIVERVRTEGAVAVRDLAAQFGERSAKEPLMLDRSTMRAALDAIPADQRAVLERTAERIRAFAAAQRASVRDVDAPIPGGRAGHTVEPVRSAGCYAPAGRYPLPSSALMTAVTARAAGCERVVVASPGAGPLMLAAAAIAGADAFLAVGGAHAIAAMTYGIDGLEPCDVIVGPVNQWVTAAKQIVNGIVGIDMLAGPSELLVIADDTAEPGVVAADLLAQAEHDTQAVPILLTTSPALADAVDIELERQLTELETRETATAALRNGFICVVGSPGQARTIADRIAAEHVEIMVNDAEAFGLSLRNAGALFLGSMSAEVLGDYGAGPNHTLPTGRTARFQAGLSVIHFLRLRTWMRIDDAQEARPLIDDAVSLAEIEGLAGHGASAMARRPGDAQH
mgnify:CR=1 FL=1